MSGDGPAGDGARPPRVLFVCTANQCRSPLAEAIARDALARRGVAAELASAGFLAPGHPASDGSVRAAARRGLDLGAHRSHRVDDATLAAADVVLTMEGAHVLRLHSEHTGAAPALCLLAACDLAAADPAAAATPGLLADGAALRAWATRAATAAARRALGTADDVADPMGGPARGYRRTADLLAERINALLDAWGAPLR